MALPALEPFTGVAGALSGSWTQQRTTRTINKNGSGAGVQDAIDDPADVTAFWSADVFNADQYSQVKIIGLGSAGSKSINIVLRASGSGDAAWNAYEIYTNGLSGATNTEVARIVNGVATIFGSFVVTFAPGDVMKGTVTGIGTSTVLSLYKNSVLVSSVTDSVAHSAVLDSGSAGVGSYWATGVVTPPTFDDWEGGNLPAAINKKILQESGRGILLESGLYLFQ